MFECETLGVDGAVGHGELLTKGQILEKKTGMRAIGRLIAA
jgi:hypothetical protein